MAEARVAVLRAAGINCDLETRHGFEACGAEARLVHVNRLLERPTILGDFGLLALPGGFSYGDHIAAGKVLALELERALGEHLQHFVQRGGLILGICNGFQVLVKTGLLPGPSATGHARRVTLSWNDSHRYEDRWVELEVDAQLCLMAPSQSKRLSLPVGHGEGRFTLEQASDLADLTSQHQTVFRYASEDGAPVNYPQNPNGSEGNVAGICDNTGQILGLMPHPDRALFPWNHPDWTRSGARTQGDGVSIFQAAVAAMR